MTPPRLAPLVEPGPELTREEVERYARHLLLPELGMVGQRRLRAARVAVVGAGGLGCPVLQYLAAAGVGTLTVIDDDLVEASNLQRQVLHGRDDVGRPKVESAAAALSALGTDSRVVPVRRRVTEQTAVDLLSGHDLVVDGTDNFPTRYVLDAAAAELGLPVVWASLMRSQAQTTTFWSTPRAASGSVPVPGVRLVDLFPHAPDPATVPSCGDAGVLGALCGMVGSAMALEAVRLVTGTGESMLGRLLFVDTATMSFSELPLAGRGEPSSGADPVGPGAVSRSGSEAPATLGGGPAAPNPMSPVALEAVLGRADQPVVLDVRTAQELALGAVPGAVHLPLDLVLDDPEAAQEVLLRAGVRLGEQPGVTAGPGVVCVCKAGVRATTAAEHLLRWGARDVHVMTGGMLAWREEVDPSLPRY